MRTHWKKVVIGLVVASLLAVTLGPWVYIHWIKADAPHRLTIDDATPATPTTPTTPATALPAVTTGSNAGENEWRIAGGSQLGYRVVEVLFGQDTEGVGRTSNVTGSLTLEGAVVSAATFTVDMSSLASDDDRRDRKFSGQIMNIAQFPTSTFTLTNPIDLGTIPDEGKEISARATGDLTLHGVTRSVAFNVTAQRTGETIGVSGSIDVKFADYDIANPSNGVVTTQDHGLIEFALVFAQG